MNIELFAEGLEFPEGPVAMADGSVICVEIKRGTLTRVTSDGVRHTVADLGGGPNGAAVGPDGAVYVCNNGGAWEWEPGELHFPAGAPPVYRGGSIQRVDLASGQVRTLYDSCDGKPLMSPNDLVFDSHGGFWFTDLGQADGDIRRLGALYYARADGSSITRWRGGLLSPNGVGLSPDERTVYMADCMVGRLFAFELSGPGEMLPSASPGPGHVICTLPGYQWLDSLAVEDNGQVCVGTLWNGGITIFDYEGTYEFVAFPDVLTTNICFGGADLMDAYVTCSSTGRIYRCRWPRPGLKLAYNG
ncbi:MAG: SMP-30/gluconolactonase/LRE family protein [Gammaproteobacteria bacterium]|nr:SMP-30/gluconolactonase/LRE family protein [Gammaproteobacteria bacterium]